MRDNVRDRAALVRQTQERLMRDNVRTKGRFHTHRELVDGAIDLIAYERARELELGMRLVAVTWGSPLRSDPWCGCEVVELLFMEKGN